MYLWYSLDYILMESSTGDNDQSVTPMLEKAIENAAFHEINLHPGVRNLANGNCAFETILDSISTRPCFPEIFDGSPDYWRRMWMTEVQKVAYERWNGGLNQCEWKKEWEVLKNTRAYECELADLVIPGIAHCTKKDILIFNTSPQAHSAVYVVPATMLCNTEADTEIPVCLAYNQVHYEMLVPNTDEDMMKTVALKKEILSGSYSVNMNDIFPPTHEKIAFDQTPTSSLKKSHIDIIEIL